MKIIERGTPKVKPPVGDEYKGRQWKGTSDCGSVVEMEQSDFDSIDGEYKFYAYWNGATQIVWTNVMCPICEKVHYWKLVN